MSASRSLSRACIEVSISTTQSFPNDTFLLLHLHGMHVNYYANTLLVAAQ